MRSGPPVGSYFVVAGRADALKVAEVEAADPDWPAWTVRTPGGARWRVTREGDGWVGTHLPADPSWPWPE